MRIREAWIRLFLICSAFWIEAVLRVYANGMCRKAPRLAIRPKYRRVRTRQYYTHT